MDKDSQTVAALTTTAALDAVAYGRAPRYEGGLRVNLRVVCADGFKVSVQASPRHYAMDSSPSGEAPYWRGRSLGDESGVAWPFVSFELGGVDDEPAFAALDEYDSSGVWAWVPREVVEGLLDSHGGAVAWEEP